MLFSWTWHNHTNTIPNKKQVKYYKNLQKKKGGCLVESRYSCEDIANMYGVSIHTVWSWVREKKLPAVKIGKFYKIRPEDLKAFEAARVTI